MGFDQFNDPSTLVEVKHTILGISTHLLGLLIIYNILSIFLQ